MSGISELGTAYSMNGLPVCICIVHVREFDYYCSIIDFIHHVNWMVLNSNFRIDSCWSSFLLSSKCPHDMAWASAHCVPCVLHDVRLWNIWANTVNTCIKSKMHFNKLIEVANQRAHRMNILHSIKTFPIFPLNNAYGYYDFATENGDTIPLANKDPV